jgi:hypothetical protein
MMYICGCHLRKEDWRMGYFNKLVPVSPQVLPVAPAEMARYQPTPIDAAGKADVVAASRRTRSGDEGASDSYKQARVNQESAMQAEARDDGVLSEVSALRKTAATLKRMIAEKDHAIGAF